VKNLFLKKTLAELTIEAGDEKHALKRSLGPVSLVMIGIGVIIGAGIFVLTGHVAAEIAGPAIVISFLIAAVACAFAGLCYAEFSSMIPVSGSAYTYAYATLGQFVAWIVGWDLILEYMLGATTVAIGWSGYLVSFLKDFNLCIPSRFTAPPLGYDPATHVWVLTGAIMNVPAVLIVILLTAIIALGIKESATLNALIVILKVAIILAFVAVGVFFIRPEFWDPFIPANAGHQGVFGFSGIMRGAGIIFFAYIGFDCVSTLAQEARNPQKDMPIGIIGSLLVCTVLYIAVALVLTGVVHYSQLGGPAPFAVVLDAMNLKIFSPLLKISALAGLTSVVLVLLLGQTRIFFSMSRDRLLPQGFSKVHPRFKTPHIITIFTGIVTAVLAGVFPMSIVGEMVSIGTLLAFVIVCAGVLTLRYTHPHTVRAFTAPGGNFTPVLGILTCLYLMFGLPQDTWMRLFIWLAIGLIVYFRYSIKNAGQSTGSDYD
jgi:APA family basic amino acid/polyamine antiporter